MNRKVRKVYACGTASLDLHLGGDTTIYPSIKALKAAGKCWKTCGIVEYELIEKRIVRKQTPWRSKK